MAIKLKLELKWTEIKRVVTVPPKLSLTDLHDVIQAMFGFDHGHLWNFQSRDGREWNTGRDPMGGRLDMDMRCMLDPDEAFVEGVLTKTGAKILYAYDYGDGWVVTVTRMADTKDDEIACFETVGTNAMDDIGGVPGLEEFTELLKNCTIKSEDEVTDDTDWRIAEWGYDDPAEREAFLRGPSKAELTERLRNEVRGSVRAREAREAAAAREALFKNVGRNDQCPCGSGLKFKKCCGR